MKTLKLLIIMILVSSLVSAQQKTIYEFSEKTLGGKDFNFADLKGKKIMIVNTASKCGYTPQYADLQKLYEQYGGEKFEIIGFPSNDFLKQEPGTNEEIAEFCQKNYGVTFTMMTKIKVKGKEMHPIYKWLTSKSLNGFSDSEVKWNFQKYIINENGELIGIFAPNVNPLDTKIIELIK